MLFYPFEITAMAGEGVVTVYSGFQHSGNYIIRSITVSKTIRHDEIKHIAGVEPFYLRRIRLSFFELIRNYSLFSTLFQNHVEYLRGCFGDIQIDNQIIWIFLPDNLLQGDVFGRDADFGRRYMFSI